MRLGIEKALFDKFNEELILNRGNAQHALARLDYLVFVENKDKFYALSEEDQMEVRMYIHTLTLIHKINR